MRRDWHEDCPRELCMQLEGDWMPLVGIVVSQPNTSVLYRYSARQAAGQVTGSHGECEVACVRG